MELRQIIKMTMTMTKQNNSLSRINKFLVATLLCLLNLAFVNAQENGDSQPPATTNNASLPIDIVADSGSYDQQAGVAIYEGNVTISQGIATIKSDRLEIILINNQVAKMIATGKPATIDYKGEKQPIYGEGNTLTYLVSEKKLELTDNALVRQGEDEIIGSKLAYELDKEKITGERVKLTLQPAN